MPQEACHSKAGTKSHATSDKLVSPILWYHALEMESMRKTVEQHSQDLTLVKSTFCGLQRLITVKVDSLVQRVEALEGAMAPGRKQGDQEAATHATQVHHEVLIERLDTVDVSMTDLETRFELLRSGTAAQLATFSMGVEHQQKELGGKEFLPMENDLQTCIAKASSHIARLERLHEKWTDASSAEQQHKAISGGG